MRPRTLEIEGLQSFVNRQKVDFDTLGETGLFGIFGPTGSGKSTVLDAVTLALYGEVNRAASGTQGIINTGASQVKVMFVFDLKKGIERKTYKVERIYQRKKGAENSCEAKIARLLEVADGGEVPLADKPREVTARVEELIGLRHDDFMRAVVLPQNKFQEFLMLEKSKKREMLERIFYLEEYGRQLTEKVVLRITSVKERLLVVQGELLALGDASEEAVKSAEESVKECLKRRNTAVAALKELEAAVSKAREVWQLVTDLEAVEAREKEHGKAADSIAEESVLLEKARRAKSLEDLILRYDNVSIQLKDVLEKLQPISEALSSYEKDLADAKETRDASTVKINTEREQLVERRARLSQALELAREMDLLDTSMESLRNSYSQLKQTLTEMDARMDDLQKNCSSLEEELSAKRHREESLSVSAEYRSQVGMAVKAEESLDETGKRREQGKQKAAELRTEVGQLNLQLETITSDIGQKQSEAAGIESRQAANARAKPGGSEEISRLAQLYHGLKGKVSLLKMKQTDMEALSLKARNLEQGLRKQKDESSVLIEKRDKILSESEKWGMEIEQLRKSFHRNTAWLLARELENGMPCPVCGSPEHPSPAAGLEDPAASGSEERLSGAEMKLSEINDRLKEAENALVSSQSQVRLLEGQLEQLSGELKDRKEEICTFTAMLADELEKESPSISMLEAEIEKIHRKQETLILAANEWEIVRERLAKQSLDAGRELAGLQTAASSLQSERNIKSAALFQMEREQEAFDAEYEEREKTLAEWTGRLGISSAVKEWDLLRQKDSEAEKLRAEIEHLRKKSVEWSAALDNVKEERRVIAEKYVMVVNDGKHLKEQKEEKSARLRQLTGGKEAAGEMETVERRLSELSRLEKESAARVEALEQKAKSLSMEKNTLESRRDTYSASAAEMKNSLALLLQEKQFSGLEEVKAAILASDREEELEKRIEEYRKEENNLKAQRTMLLRKLEGRSITSGEWEELQSRYSQALQEKDESSSAYEVARNVRQTLQVRYQRWSELSREYKSVEHNLGMLEHIRTLLKGNSFIEYVAEERLRYIAREASEILGVMTRYRYALALDSDNGFVIRDNSSGGVHRPVHSLSGGEIFLTSLSLALALSSQIHLKGQSPLEFFFLDEGFGTLDNKLLELVIDSLERISTKDRVIGLISHVPELKNRISRRLVVEPPDLEGNGSRVRIEKA